MTIPMSRNFNDAKPLLPGNKSFAAYPAAREPTASRSPYMRNRWSAGSDRVIALVLTLFCGITRLYRIGRRTSCAWDESHFGKFGAFYVRGKFFMDVHPPAAKMLVALSEVLAGHNGTFEFKGGEEYPAYVNYVFMRGFNAMFGIALAPLAYLTCRLLRLPPAFAAMAALFVTFDNAITVISRFILLDAPLLAFTALALAMLAGFYRQHARPFSSSWWQWLFGMGVALGLVASAKWVGLFAVALAGAYTIYELWEMFCEPRLQLGAYAKHWAARMAALIVVPVGIYMFWFWIHFAVLTNYDASAAFMPMGFQARLKGSPLAQQPYEVTTGSAIRLQAPGGAGYLHSHVHRYPAGSMRQQITGYGYADGNNVWGVERRAPAGDTAGATAIDGRIEHGDIIALRHNSTDTYLIADSAFAAPVSSNFREVSAVGVNRTEAAGSNALWKVEIVNAEPKMADGVVHPLGTPLRLRNVGSNCVLASTGARLDKNWGWGQAEIACSTNSDSYLWTVERHINDAQPKRDIGRMLSSSFLREFAVLNRQMWLTNNALVPDHDKHNVLESGPASWLFLKYPMRMVGWDDRSVKFLEIGNPILWWAAAVVSLLFPVQTLYWMVCQQRGVLRWPRGTFRAYYEGACILWGGWFLHYAPFFAMGRVTYLHHFLPALYFSLLLLAYQMYYWSLWYAPRRMYAVPYAAVAVAALVFWWFSPLTYGWDKPITELRGMEWVSSWPIYKDKLSL